MKFTLLLTILISGCVAIEPTYNRSAEVDNVLNHSILLTGGAK